MAEAMRGFTFEKFDLNLLVDESHVEKKFRDPKLYAAKWQIVFSYTLTFVLCIWVFLVSGGRFNWAYSSIPDSQPLIWIYYNHPLAWAIAGALTICAFYSWKRIFKFTENRWAKIAQLNNLTRIKYGKPLMPGSIVRDASGYINAFKLNGPLSNVSFGVVSGWWDIYTKPKVTGGQASILCEQLFVRVELPEVSGPTKVFNPNHAWKREELPELSDSAFKAVKRLASLYSVVIGEGQILIAVAGGTKNSPAESLEGDLDTPNGWKLCSSLISNELATVVEGLEL
jgi:hypothetical protein